MSKKEIKIGLALGGGSARGWAHVGVIRALRGAGIPIHCIAGTSIGSVIGGYYASGSFDELEKMANKVEWGTFLQYIDIVLPRQGLVEGKKILAFLRKTLKIKTIQNLSIPFCAVAADMVTGKEIHIRKGNLAEAMRASISIPGILNPVKKSGGWMVDGGLVNPVPVSAARAMGADIVIAVDLNHDFSQSDLKFKISEEPNHKRQESWGEELRRHTKGAGETLKNKFKEWTIGNEPVIFDVIGWSVNIMQDQITQKNLLTEKPDFLIRPRLGSVRAFDFHLAKPMIEEGVRQTQKILGELRAVIH
ncbi:patatin-like phospholipase family protein [Candidatus Peregrinibacteria bacterium]|nr:patatin-like phospholipase family protein [Candidatus Peregrinibacteria bacterium]